MRSERFGQEQAAAHEGDRSAIGPYHWNLLIES